MSSCLPRSLSQALVAGVDEAGRGPLAGPVAIAAVILDPDRPIDGLDDSKALCAAAREALFEQINARCLARAVVLVDASQIDRLNILQATMAGMRQVLSILVPAPVLALIDGNRLPPALPCPAQCLVGGDRLEPAISAASILAKVSRDRYMTALARRWPGYGFEQHKGYPTAAHLDALQRLGPCPEHRRSFAPVRSAMLPLLL